MVHGSGRRRNFWVENDIAHKYSLHFSNMAGGKICNMYGVQASSKFKHMLNEYFCQLPDIQQRCANPSNSVRLCAVHFAVQPLEPRKHDHILERSTDGAAKTCQSASSPRKPADEIIKRNQSVSHIKSSRDEKGKNFIGVLTSDKSVRITVLRHEHSANF